MNKNIFRVVISKWQIKERAKNIMAIICKDKVLN